MGLCKLSTSCHDRSVDDLLSNKSSLSLSMPAGVWHAQAVAVAGGANTPASHDVLSVVTFVHLL
jgi:hypothetical protein